MEFSQDNVESYNRLKATLKDLVVGETPELTIAQDGGHPLLVLETSCDSVGFAVVNGDPEPAFASAYESFKNLYRQKHSAWKERNLSFVICRSESGPTHDAFFSAIETDVYFCRKYVVCLHHNYDELVRELLRLPFLPLPEGRAGGILRPPSAQTLLQSLKVSAQIARQIIVPLECSANRIVDQLLAGKEPLPALGVGVGPSIQHQIQPTERTRIRTVEIKAFRVYRKRQEFDVDADVVVFYGPNGLGKTSFFDALDYVCTGRIGRLCRRRISQNDFIELARHLGSSASEGYVSMQVSQGATVCSVRRNVADWGNARIGTDKYDRADALQFLTSSHWEEKKPRIENLERLFRATHLFGQSDPELLVEFEKDSTLSSDLVHRMLALDDYASGLAKATAVLALLDKQLSENKREASLLDVRANEVQSQIKALPAPQDAVEAGKQLRNTAMNLVKDLQAHTGATIDNVEPSQASAREWRAMAESALKDIRDRLSQLQSIESGFAQFADNRSELKHIANELPKSEAVLKEKTADFRRQQEARKTLIGNLEQEQIDLAQATLRLRALAEMDSLQDIFLKTRSSLQQWQLELKRVAGEADATTAELQPLLPTAEKLRDRIAELHEVIQVKSQRIHALSNIQEGLQSWEKNHTHIIKLQQAIAGARAALQKAGGTIDELKTGIAARTKELVACEKEYEDHTANQSELTRLLDEIEAHVENGICPTCGIDHESKATLVERIHTQKQARPPHVETLAKRCDELRKILKQDNASLETLIGERAAKGGELEEMTNKLSEILESVAAFEGIVSESKLPMDKQLAATVARKLMEEKTVLWVSQETLTNVESDLTSTTKRITELEQKLTQQSEARKRAEASIMPLEQQITLVRAKAEASDLSLEITPEAVVKESAALMSRKAGAEKRISGLTPQIEIITQKSNEMEKHISAVTEKIKTLRRNKERLAEAVRRYEENAASVIRRNALSQDAISEQRRLATERVDLLDTLRGRCITLERTVDAAQRSALLAEREAQAQSLAKQKQDLVAAAARMSEVRKWFTSVKDALDKKSSTAVTNHVDAFGPLASLIQKRLRAVYGFGDVKLHAKGNEIYVEVGWETKHVKPTDYFSDSQKQILMLSLFLAGRLTQTWSGFAPILMDDPVTHFDDLNAFGFVELIRGLISASPGKRQFFISTCEDRLFELMLKKFASAEAGAKFYRFEGIGPDGPIIRHGK